jgi:dTDP-4-amino-4,6-dideoxygalactose transaminase
VITSPLSFFASAGVIARLGARPVFVDVEPHTCTLDPSALRDAITARTRAIVPVHLFGRTCDPEVFAIAEAHGVPVVEDAAQALFASNARGSAGTLGALGCFSFFPTKNLGALGDGGLVVTHDTALAERVRLLRAQGARPRYHHVAIGGNFRLDALQAALLRVKLPHVARWNAERRDRAARYDTAFASLAAAGALTLPAIDAGHVVHQYVVRTPHRDALRGALAARGIATEIYYPEPLHLAPCFSELGHTQGRFPEAERACREGLALPIAPGLSSADEARVIAAVVAYFEGAP